MTINSRGNKPRFDGGGCEFGILHRELSKGRCLFDIDRLFAHVELAMRQDETLFVEYSTDFNTATIRWIAIFEMKYRNGLAAQEALQLRVGTAVWAQLQLANQIGARFFVVVGTGSKDKHGAPFTFFETLDNQTFEEVGILDYTPENIKEAVNIFWRDVLGLPDVPN